MESSRLLYKARLAQLGCVAVWVAIVPRNQFNPCAVNNLFICYAIRAFRDCQTGNCETQQALLHGGYRLTTAKHTEFKD